MDLPALLITKIYLVLLPAVKTEVSLLKSSQKSCATSIRSEFLTIQNCYLMAMARDFANAIASLSLVYLHMWLAPQEDSFQKGTCGVCI